MRKVERLFHVRPITSNYHLWQLLQELNAIEPDEDLSAYNHYYQKSGRLLLEDCLEILLQKKRRFQQRSKFRTHHDMLDAFHNLGGNLDGSGVMDMKRIEAVARDFDLALDPKTMVNGFGDTNPTSPSLDFSQFMNIMVSPEPQPPAAKLIVDEDEDDEEHEDSHIHVTPYSEQSMWMRRSIGGSAMLPQRQGSVLYNGQNSGYSARWLNLNPAINSNMNESFSSSSPLGSSPPPSGLRAIYGASQMRSGRSRSRSKQRDASDSLLKLEGILQNHDQKMKVLHKTTKGRAPRRRPEAGLTPSSPKKDRRLDLLTRAIEADSRSSSVSSGALASGAPLQPLVPGPPKSARASPGEGCQLPGIQQSSRSTSPPSPLNGQSRRSDQQLTPIPPARKTPPLLSMPAKRPAGLVKGDRGQSSSPVSQAVSAPELA